jgi:hypothetical protein
MKRHRGRIEAEKASSACQPAAGLLNYRAAAGTPGRTAAYL